MKLKAIELELLNEKKRKALERINKEFNDICCPNYHNEEQRAFSKKHVEEQYEIQKNNLTQH